MKKKNLRELCCFCFQDIKVIILLSKFKIQKTLREPETLLTLDFLSSQDYFLLFVYHSMLEIVY
jgi:hypothetical protein